MSTFGQFTGGVKSVQRGSKVGAGTITITTVDTSKCILKATRIDCVANGSGFYYAGYIALTNSTTLTVTSVGGSDLVIYWELQELN